MNKDNSLYLKQLYTLMAQKDHLPKKIYVSKLKELKKQLVNDVYNPLYFEHRASEIIKDVRKIID